jgi:hypothetical protein
MGDKLAKLERQRAYLLEKIDENDGVVDMMWLEGRLDDVEKEIANLDSE